ncbi:two component transcriptional regulator, LytTR family [Chitinophaga costaii]|uniref:Two component transcriptional regulator, LytTR family n=1 Tax=Chitinophaga costaii TaxID=1335309 RepID=A0A1C4FR24_9BACT|nr:response regulator [Chitinophaga costaii]PUZ20455.1 hypothetical protein DCM91_18635 [Chitinophaga costaii]SCC58103.1 two component transcriptional regulator, LytTR family [Chitinophaga costaii]
MIKAIIIDDERNSRDIIALMLERYCPNVEVLALANDCAEGIVKIKEYQPDLVFLDLEMPDGTGFEVLQGLDDINFEAIFVTAFEKKFVHTIRFSEVELILKPIDKESLLQAVNTVQQRISGQVSKQRYKVLMENFLQGRQEHWQLVLPSATSEIMTTMDEILYLEAGQEQCIFHLRKGAPVTVERPFRYYLDLLGNMPFFQINNTQTVNLKAVLQLSADKTQVVLPNNIRLDMTDRRRKEFMSKWK